MNLLDLKSFVLVAASGSVTAAAKTLGVPKSTVSRRVQRLEDELGHALVVRSPNRIRFTDQGRLLYERCAPALAEIENAERELEGRDAEPAGLLRITILMALANAPMLTRLFLEFIRLHPRVELHVLATNQVLDLVEERIDVAIRPVALSVMNSDAQMQKHLLGRIHGALFASPTFIEQNGRPATLDEVSDYVHVLNPDVMRPGVTLVNERGKERRIELRARFQTSSISQILHATLQGETLGLLPSLLADTEVAAGRLIPIFPDWRFLSGRLGLVYPTVSTVPAKTRAFVAFLQERAMSSGLVTSQ